ncbi:leucine-rich repeat-containing protein 43 isoform X2 [Lathamus discolor]|uniref:leucine-rich repeat-containing protein 43 isoform X2 n=1 Tax=Lathamus discolor TaxID=678569 RepID=UPI0032B7F26C
MAAPGPGSVSAALQEHLRHLTLQDFPCGLGSWVGSRGGRAMDVDWGLWSAGLSLPLLSPSLQNKSRFAACRSPHRGQPRLWADQARQEEDLPLGEESPEALIELLKDRHSPWALPPGCRPQDQLLREVAVLEPKLVHGSNVFQVLRSLRIVDKGVEEVDAGLLQLQQLEELILSANHISRVTSANLPRTLKILELCCNAVADLQDLCAQPPPELQHLGLGYNRLCGPLQAKCLTAAFWPNLVSLDLSFNNLTDLLGLVSQLSGLEKLRILVLKGNPLALIPTYRGFLVDSLPKLSILDDIHVGFDERHQFLGLASQPELMRSEARVVVSVGDMKGVPDPSTLQQLADNSYFPVITYSYCVTYEFVEGEELDDGSSTEVTKIHESLEGATLGVHSSAQDTGETKDQQDPAATEQPKASSAKVFATPGKPWKDTIEYSYRKEHIVKDLMGLKSYLAAGTIVSVVEEKVLSWPVEADPEENIDRNKKAGQRQQKDGAKGPARKDKQKKKKSCELRSDPPIRKTLGTRKVTLETLLATGDLVTALCDFGILVAEKPQQTRSVEEKEKSKRKAPVCWRKVKGCSQCH